MEFFRKGAIKPLHMGVGVSSLGSGHALGWSCRVVAQNINFSCSQETHRYNRLG